MQTRKQKLSKQIMAQINVAAGLEDGPNGISGYKKKYGTMAHRLPILVRTAGLVQALAFVQAKRGNVGAWGDYLDDVAVLLLGEGADGEALITASQHAPLSEYILLTRRVNEALVWYKRFAESILKVDASEQDDSQAGLAGGE
jgi:CRISPR-associated protein Cmr5